MLTFRQLDDLPNSVIKIMAEAEQSIINDMARRISSLGEVTDATNWQLSRLEAINTEQKHITKELSRALKITEKRLVELFDEAATRTLKSDNKMYEAAGYNPVPLAENPYLQQVIFAGLNKTAGEFSNLTKTTAKTATRQFERALDLAHQQIVSGGMDYKTATKNAIRSLASKGIEAIKYPTGHTDYLDTAIRRSVLTGVNQTAAEIQLGNTQQLGTDLVETTAHHSARPEHAVWQGKVFSVSGTHKEYPSFSKETGYGTGPGLCGWNCRHSFFPYFEGLSDPAYTPEKLHEYNHKKVTYNDKEMSLYDATQHQRHTERQIRRWKREEGALESAGIDSAVAKRKVREWQKQQRDFVDQTGLSRDYFRERAGKQNLERPANKYTSLLNVQTNSGVGVKNISGHFVERLNERHIQSHNVKDALTKPLHVGKIEVRKNGSSQIFIGDKATASINPNTGNLITVYRTSRGSKYRRGKDD